MNLEIRLIRYGIVRNTPTGIEFYQRTKNRGWEDPFVKSQHKMRLFYRRCDASLCRNNFPSELKKGTRIVVLDIIAGVFSIGE